jgi:rhodanese-related sulfurtransferase
MVKTIAPEQAAELARSGKAVLVDIRESGEFASERIPGAVLQPLSVLPYLPPDSDKEQAAIYFCHSGRRTEAAKDKLEARGHAETYLLDGGLEGWKKAHQPVEETKGPLPLMRQVHITAGCLVVLFLLIGQHVPFFRLLAVFVGFGLIFSGITGWCGLMLLLQKMPWNKNVS